MESSPLEQTDIHKLKQKNPKAVIKRQNSVLLGLIESFVFCNFEVAGSRSLSNVLVDRPELNHYTQFDIKGISAFYLLT
jgi:hypothetical protein